MTGEKLFDTPLDQIGDTHPDVVTYLKSLGLLDASSSKTINELLMACSAEDFDDVGVDAVTIKDHIGTTFMAGPIPENEPVRSVTIIGGHNKHGCPEGVKVILESGTVTSIVGPTGSGKSRLLADIEWMAQGDTPTGRHILINGKCPDASLRFSLEHKLVAQLSQNMNFVMDATVSEFIALHAESRSMGNPSGVASVVLEQANLLAGESFTAETPLTALSGGQSRALMIADTAFLSVSPVVLIDEIENAGIDRKQALSLLVRNDKVVLIATHDPILALMADRRLVIKHGGIDRIIETTASEKNTLEALQTMDRHWLYYRNCLRNGDLLDTQVNMESSIV